MTQISIGLKWYYSTIFAVFVIKRTSIQGFMQAVFEFDIQNEYENLHRTSFSNCNSVQNLRSNPFLKGMDENVDLPSNQMVPKCFHEDKLS
jgi:hypothetical protein